ncbi:hypothetical protein BJX96DRAFT_15559 [Aspergillus floccosus]
MCVPGPFAPSAANKNLQCCKSSRREHLQTQFSLLRKSFPSQTSWTDHPKGLLSATDTRFVLFFLGLLFDLFYRLCCSPDNGEQLRWFILSLRLEHSPFDRTGKSGQTPSISLRVACFLIFEGWSQLVVQIHYTAQLPCDSISGKTGAQETNSYI